MYKHILLPTDGSEQDREAIISGVALAKALGARVTGLHVIVESSVAAGIGKSLRSGGEGERQARENLDVVTKEAVRADVPHECFFVRNSSAADAIIRAAAQKGCDLIAMASHGHRGVARLVLGSVTSQVLNECRNPVLVYR